MEPCLPPPSLPALGLLRNTDNGAPTASLDDAEHLTSAPLHPAGPPASNGGPEADVGAEAAGGSNGDRPWASVFQGGCYK